MNHEKLNCYQNLLYLADELNSISSLWPQGQSYLKDQLKRAIGSALLNLAEGNGKRSTKDRRRFFHISQGSIAEVAACLDLGTVFSLIPTKKSQGWKAQLLRCYNQISRLP
jgi:four helix bundle protein